jgi:predicted XRE-type DNA-binding protein
MTKIVHGSTNVFADIDLLDASERKAKLKLALVINDIIAARKLPQAQAANFLEINQPKISALANYKLERFSVEGLMNFLTALDRDVEIIIHKPKKRSKGSVGRGEIRVAAA